MILDESEILGASILIVDDQEANIDLISEMLKAAGYTRVSSTMDPHAVAAVWEKFSATSSASMN